METNTRERDALPDNIGELKRLVDSYQKTIDEHKRTIDEKDRTIDEKDRTIDKKDRTIEERERAIRDITFQLLIAKENYEALRHRYFGSSSEKTKDDPSQPTFEFDEAEAHAPESEDTQEPPIVVASHTRKKRGRKALKKDIETIEIVHDVPDEDKHCPFCGKERPSMGEERTEEYELVPAHIVKKVHVIRKYGACRCDAFDSSDEKRVVTARGPSKIVPRSVFSNSTIAFFMVSKFCDAIPFCRMSTILSRYGLDVGRATLCALALSTGRAIGDIIERMWVDVRGSPAILMDETTLQVLKNPKGDPRSTCYMWVTCGFHKGHAIHLFHYHSSRKKEIAERTLEEFSGYLQTDGYEGYSSVGARDGITHVGCWAHIRRKFIDAKKVGGNPGLADEMIGMIAKIYAIEKREREMFEKGNIDSMTFIARRKDALSREFMAIRLWLSEKSLSVAPQCILGKAISYALSQIAKAERFVESEHLTPDTNRVENAIRPFVVGRKNWLFNESERGAHASAGLYSIIETAKANGHEPLRYLTHLFETLPTITEKSTRELLAPHLLSPTSY